MKLTKEDFRIEYKAENRYPKIILLVPNEQVINMDEFLNPVIYDIRIYQKKISEDANYIYSVNIIKSFQSSEGYYITTHGRENYRKCFNTLKESLSAINEYCKFEIKNKQEAV